MSDASSTESPFRGLMPYTENDAPFFFGRESERELISANLLASRLTLLYGASGVGKTSVLQAGVAFNLRRTAQEETREHGDPKFTVVIFNSWSDDPIKTLLQRVREAITEARAGRNIEPLDASGGLVETLQAWAQRERIKLLIILDQFDEYFLYHPNERGDRSFFAEFPRAVNRSSLHANFLISIREDALAKLDCFKGEISNLFDNYLRIEHLTRDAARAAIEKPIGQYNKLRAAKGKEVQIEPALVEEVLKQLEPLSGKALLGAGGGGEVGARGSGDDARREADDSARIETPYLQLVMDRLWKEELGSGSRVLRLETLTRLGGAKEIVRTHLYKAMEGLTSAEQDIAAQIFRHLVTPSGTKIAQSATDLADYARLQVKQVERLLERLSGSQFRILHPIPAPPDHPGSPRYEIYHDALAAAILDYVRARKLQRLHLRIFQGSAATLVVFAILVFWAHSLWMQNRPWAYLTNLSTGRAHPLTSDLVSIGRATDKYLNNTINLLPSEVSRLHLLISKQGVAVDTRSLRGTTVNGEFLFYGESAELKANDVIVLSGFAPFRFTPIDYGRFQFWTPEMEVVAVPSPAWGMLIDDKSKTVSYLDKLEYFLSLNKEGRLVSNERQTGEDFMKFQIDDKGLAVAALDQKDAVSVDIRQGDYMYVRCKVSPGSLSRAINTNNLSDCKPFFSREDDSTEPKGGVYWPSEVAYSYRENRFQIVPIVPLDPPKEDAKDTRVEFK